MNTPIEERLTEALREAAEAIARSDEAEPASSTHLADPFHRNTQRRPLRWLLPAVAAAAVVAVVAALTIGLRHVTAPPAAPHGNTSSAPSPHASTSTAPAAVTGIHPASCRARQTDPFSGVLKQILTTGAQGSYDLAGLPLLAVTSDGAALAGTTGGRSSPARLDLIHPDGSRSTLYRATDVPLSGDDAADISAAQGDARWVVFGVFVGADQKDLRRLGVVDRRSGVVTTFRTLPLNDPTIMQPPVLSGGRAYWSETDSSGTGAVFAYDPTDGRTDVVDRGRVVTRPTVIGGGLYWQRDGRVVAYHAGAVPAGFPLATASFPKTATDGTTTVWAAMAGVPGRLSLHLELGRPGMAAPLTIYESSAAANVIPLAVAGPFVIWDDTQTITALDTRTGATAQIGYSSPGFSTVSAGGGMLAVNQIGSKGGAQLFIARIAALPELHC